MKRFAGLFCGLLVLLMAFSATALAEEAEVKRFEEGKELLLFEQDGIKISLTGEVKDNSEYFLEIILGTAIENNSKETVKVRYSGVINGIGATFGFGDVWPGANSENNVVIVEPWLNIEDEEDVKRFQKIEGFDDLEEMELNIEVCNLDDEVLFTVDPITIHFPGYKGEIEQETKAQETNSESSTETVVEETDIKRFEKGKELVLFEQDGIKVGLTGKYKDFSDVGVIDFTAAVENNLEEACTVWYTGAVNGLDFQHGVEMGIEIWPDAKGKDTLSVNYDALEVRTKEDAERAKELKKFDDFETLELNMRVCNPDGEEMFAVDPITIYFPGYKGEDGTLQTLKTGSRGDAVVKLQEKLIELGYLDGEADGAYGKNTAKGVSSFQAAEGLEETGIADAITQERLFAK